MITNDSIRIHDNLNKEICVFTFMFMLNAFIYNDAQNLGRRVFVCAKIDLCSRSLHLVIVILKVSDVIF